MASTLGRRFAVSRSFSHALTLGDPKNFSNRASDAEENFLEPNAPRTIRVPASQRSRF